jgi:hypothetical protein
MRNKANDVSVQLNQLLRANKKKLFPLFSRAHIEDLKNDLTENKFKDTIFIEEIAGQYMLYYDAIHKRQELYLVSPTSSLKSHLEVTETDLSNIFELGNDDTSKGLEDQLNNILDMPLFNINLPSLEMEKYKDTLMNFLPLSEKPLSIRDFMNHMQTLMEQLFDKKSQLYKKTRKVNIDQFNFNQVDFSITNFNDILKKSPLGKSLSELINSSDQKLSNSDYFTKGFVLLNMLGLDKEKNKKTNFISLSNDSQHSYYASFCDIFITEDKGLRLKSELLYSTQNISTRIMTPEQFLSIYNEFEPEQILTPTDFIEKITDSLKESKPYSIFKSTTFNRFTEYHLLDKMFFDFFNHVEVIRDEDSGTFVVLTSNKSNYYTGIYYDEIELITNKIAAVFGLDLEGHLFFLPEDKTQLAKSDWSGRIWKAISTPISLEINKGTDKLSIVIGPC